MKDPSVRDRQENQGLSHPCLQMRNRCVQKGMPNPAWELSEMASKLNMGLEISLKG